MFTLISFKSAKSLFASDNVFENYAKEIIGKILKNDKITKRGHKEDKFHFKFKKLSENYYIVDVVLDEYKPKQYSKKIRHLNFDAYLYSGNNNANLDKSVFFIPDSIYWQFLIYVEGDKITILKKMILYD